MSVNKYINGELITLANGSRTWIGTKEAYEAAKQAGTLPNDCLIAITDDENDRAISGTNLLDNPWFTINQRGQSSYSNGYAVDRWRANSGMTCDVTDNGVTLTHPDNTDNADFLQYYESDRLKDAVGKNVTVSVMTSDGNIYTQTAEVPTIDSSRKVVVRFDIGSTAFKCDLIIRASNPFLAFYSTTANATISIKAVKLEIGTASTLENDTAPNYQQELAKCQRYYVRYKSELDNTRNIYRLRAGYGMSVSASLVQFLLFTPVEMRAVPTIKNVGIGAYIPEKQDNLIAITDNSLVAIVKNGNVVNVRWDTTGLEKGYTAMFWADGADHYIELSADL